MYKIENKVDSVMNVAYFNVNQAKEIFGLVGYPIEIVMRGLVLAQQNKTVDMHYRIECKQCGTINYILENEPGKLSRISEFTNGVIECDYCQHSLTGDTPTQEIICFSLSEQFKPHNFDEMTDIGNEEKQFESMKQETMFDKVKKWLRK